MKNTLIDSVKLARKEARKMLRALRINSVTQKLNKANAKLNELAVQKAHDEKTIAIAEYEMSVLDIAHPLFEDRKKEYESKIAIYRTVWLAGVDAKIVEAKAKVERIEAFIKKVADGEVKMSLYEINRIANEKLANI